MTLLELLVVLAILAAMTMVALQSMNGVVGQSRFEATQRSLTDIQSAVVGQTASSGAANSALSSFVGDMGRLPTTLQELVTNTASAPPFSLQEVVVSQSGETTKTIHVPTGWRGPYLRLPMGATAVLDGWGREIQFESSAGVWFRCASLGADGQAGVSTGSYDADLHLVLPWTPAAQQTALASYPGAMLTPPPIGAKISGIIYMLDSAGNKVPPANAGGLPMAVTLALYSPDPSVPIASPQGVSKQDISPLTSGASGFSYTITNPTIGPKVLVVTLDDPSSSTNSYVSVDLTVYAGQSHDIDIRVQ